jgi:hypothetical protein
MKDISQNPENMLYIKDKMKISPKFGQKISNQPTTSHNTTFTQRQSKLIVDYPQGDIYDDTHCSADAITFYIEANDDQHKTCKTFFLRTNCHQPLRLLSQAT